MPIREGLSQEDLRRRLGIGDMNDVERREKAVAVEHALRSMSPHLRDVCRELTDGSILAAARALNASRRQVRNAVRVIRRHLERAGLGNI